MAEGTKFDVFINPDRHYEMSLTLIKHFNLLLPKNKAKKSIFIFSIV